MCGIAALLEFGGRNASRSIIESMTLRLAHRGPDGDGAVISGPAALGHRRLAIQDPALGVQPMSDSSDQIVITFNGEIYNYPALREYLASKGISLRTHSDTEAIIYCYMLDPDNFVSRLSGMFAFVIWDKRTQTMTIARDFIGVKPIYYYRNRNFIAISSEIKGLLAHPQVPCRPDMSSIADILAFQNTHGADTCFEDIKLVNPGEIIRVDASGSQRTSRHFSFSAEPALRTNRAEASLELTELLSGVVEAQLLSDVPVGAYLSGGMDTGLISTFAARKLGRLKTFSGGFQLAQVSTAEKLFDERDAAEFMSAQLGTDHSFTEIGPEDLLDNFSAISWHLEEPRGSTCYAPFVMAREAASKTKVVLSGHGGDELFCGYRGRYLAAREYGKDWERKWLDHLNHAVPLHEFSKILDTGSFGADAAGGVLSRYSAAVGGSRGMSAVSRAQHYDLFGYMQGLLLIEDKLSMAHGLESRVPLLDRKLFDFAWSLPDNWKLSADFGKVIVRESMQGVLPAEILARDKMGFGPPDNSYYRTNLKSFFEDVIANGLMKRGFIHKSFGQRVLDEHMGGIPRANVLWTLASIELWFRTFHDRSIVGTAEAGPIALSVDTLDSPVKNALPTPGVSIAACPPVQPTVPRLAHTANERSPTSRFGRGLRVATIVISQPDRAVRGLRARTWWAVAALRRVARGALRRLGRLPGVGASYLARGRRAVVNLFVPPSFRTYTGSALRLACGSYNLEVRSRLNLLLADKARQTGALNLSVFHGLYSTVQPSLLNKEFRNRGFNSRFETLDNNSNFTAADAVHRDVHHPDFYFEHITISGGRIEYRMPPFTDSYNLNNLEQYFIRNWGNYNVYHFNWFLSFLPSNTDVEYLRRSGAAVYFHWRGCFVLTKLAPEFAARGQSVVDACASCKLRGWRDTYFRRFDRGVTNASRVLVSTPNLCHCDSRFEYLPLSLDPDLEEIEPKVYSGNDQERPILIMHAPSSVAMEEVKGTGYVQAAVEQLVRDGLNVTLRLVQNMARAEAMAAFREADIFVEQLTLGSYGNTAIEAMAHGVPVISSHNPAHQHLTPGCPVVHADPLTLVDRLRELVTDEEARRTIGLAGYRFVREFHSNRRIVNHLTRLYGEDLGTVEKTAPNNLSNESPSYG